MQAHKPVLIIQPGFAGDILFCMKIAAVWAGRGHRVIFPVEPRFSDISTALELPPGVEMPLTSEDFPFRDAYFWFLRATDEAAGAGDFSFHQGPIELQDLIVLPLASSWWTAIHDTMAVKYRLTGIDPSDWADYVHIKRDRPREERLLAELGIREGRDFVLVNDSGRTRTLDLTIDGDCVRMRAVEGFTLLDWAAVAERAREIITIDTSLVLLIEVLKLDKPLQVVSRYTPPEFHIAPILRLDWRFANTVADLGPPATRGEGKDRGTGPPASERSKEVPVDAPASTPVFSTHRPDFHRHFNGFPEFQEMSAAWLHDNVANNSGDYPRLYMLYQNIKRVIDDGVQGDFVELGVYKGNSAFVLAALARLAKRKTYLYDTFEGFDRRDLTGIDSVRAVEFDDTSLEAVQHLVGMEDVVFARGHFPLSALKFGCPEKIAVAHIDCDLHDPIRAGLEAFYPRLAPGGILIIHDYASGFWPGATKAVDEFLSDKPERPVIIPDKSGSAVVRRCFGVPAG